MSDRHEPTTPRRSDDDEETLDVDGPCMACGAPNAHIWATPDGPARLCPTCATLNGIGCP